MNIITEYPLWFILFCVAAGLGYSLLLYRKDKKFDESSKWLIRAMAFFRFLVVSILAFFLLSPLIKNIEREVEKPVVVIAHDNSESLLANKDSSYYKKEYKEQWNKTIDLLKEKYDVKLYSFADKFDEVNSFDSLNYKDKQTDISSVFDELTTIYSNRNVGAIIIASDGLYNKGANPQYVNNILGAPIYTIALGDTTVRKDLILTKVNHNRVAYLGNQFPVEVVVNAKELKGKTTTLSLSKDNVSLFSQVININNDNFLQTYNVLLDAKQSGLQHYRVQLTTVEGEISKANNAKDIFIDVMDGREKVLILSEAPHPDIAALKEAIAINQNYEVESFLIDDFNQSVKKYNLVILNQIQSSKALSSNVLKEISENNISVWALSGAGASLRNDIFKPITVSRMNEVEPVLDENFPLFTLSDEFKKVAKKFPAINSPFGSYQSSSANVLFYQRIGIVDTKTPLLLFNTSGNRKTAILNGEGIWKWRLYEYAINKNHNAFNEFVSKVVQYLSIKDDKSFFRIISKNNFMENESIEMDAELYNQSYELINEPDVNITITNSENKNFSFAFGKTSNAYRLNAGMFPVGQYKYSATAKVADKIYYQNGMFSVTALQVELTNTTADHLMLYNLAKKRKGEMLYPQQLENIVNKLNAREDIKSISYSQKKLNDLINLKWIFFLLLALLSLEWFMRKRNGVY